MKHKIFALSMALVSGIAAMPAVTATAAEQEEPDISIRALLPQNDEEFLAFREEYGAFSAIGQYAVYCGAINTGAEYEMALSQTGTAEFQEVLTYSIDSEQSVGDYTRMVFVYEAVTPGTVDFAVSQVRQYSSYLLGKRCFSVAEDRTVTAITQAELSAGYFEAFPFLPQTPEDYSAFLAENGSVSVRDKYVIYCGKVNYSTGAELVAEQSGEGRLREIFSYSVSDEESMIPGAATPEVHLFMAVSAGVVQLNIMQGRPWQWEESKETCDCSDYLIAADMTVTRYRADMIAGDVNADGIFSTADAVALLKWLHGEADGTLADWMAGDLNRDGKLNATDLLLMKRALCAN